MIHIVGLFADSMLLGLVYAIVGLGLSLVMGIMGIVNVAHSAFIMLGSYFAFELSRRIGIDPIVSFFLCMPFFFAIGVLLYRLLVTRVERAAQTQGLVAMFGLMVLIESISTIVWTTDTRVITVSYTNTSVAIGPLVLVNVRMIAGVLAFILVVGFWAFLKYTVIGRGIRAVGQNREAAIALGLNVRQLTAVMFGLGVACAGAAGVALSMIFPFAPGTQVQWLAWAFLVVVLGGLGNVGNTLVAGIMVAMIQTFAAAYLPFDYVYLLLYGTLAVILVVRREGLGGAMRRSI
jgi:branched-chain amino acid transport system permease protein